MICNFFFSHIVFSSFGELSAIFNKFEIVLCKLSLEESKTYCLGKGLDFKFFLKQQILDSSKQKGFTFSNLTLVTIVGREIFLKQQTLDSSKQKGFTFSNLTLVTIVEREILLILSNFSFSHNFFKRCIVQTCIKTGLFGEGLS